MDRGIVAGEDDDRVVGDPGQLDAVDDLPDPVVHFRHQVRVQAQARRIGLVESGYTFSGGCTWERPT